MPHGRRRIALALALLVPGGALAGCGGDEVSNEAYAKRVNEVCTNIEREFNRLARTRPDGPGAAAELIDEVIVKSRHAVGRLRAIERPEGGGGAAADRFVSTLEREFEQRAIPALEDLRSAVRRQDREAAGEAAARLERLESSESDSRARAVGADVCAA
jgi:hypothetical protein